MILTKGFLLNVLNGYATRAYERVTAMAIASKFGARMISAITSVAALAMLSGCQGDPTVWKKDVLAPGGGVGRNGANEAMGWLRLGMG